MCGINGILYFNGKYSDRPEAYFRGLLEKMNEAIAHRGPDGAGVHVNYPMCMGHRRLSIIDLSENGAQPMFNEDRSLAIVFNGEIYNYLELIPELISEGHVFRSRTDTEVILHAYEKYGPECVKKFNGMWAFVIYDFKQRVLFASRDRFGVKPFYYFSDAEHFVFSSEIKAILEVKKINAANRGKVYDYLAYGYKTNNGETFFQNIYELKPGHNLIIKNANLSFSRYWDLHERIDDYGQAGSLIEWSDRFIDLLNDAIKLRFRSDVPVAILLSGGLDSTSIARTVDDLIEEGTLGCQEVTAYSAAFPGFVYDEGDRAKEFIETCRHIRLQKVLPDGSGLMKVFDRFVHGLGEPLFSSTSFAHYALMKEIHNQGVKVVLNGQGADEAFCGYDRYIIGYFLLDILFSRQGDFVPQMKAIHQKLSYPYSYIFAQFIKAILPRRYASYLRGKYQEGTVDCLRKEFVEDNYYYLRNSSPRLFDNSNLAAYLKFNIDHYGFNQILHYEDHSSMQHSVEIRSPYIDYRIMELAFSLPSAYKFDMGVTKRIIRTAFGERLPRTIINNNPKIGFATPFSTWLKDDAFNAYVMDIIHSESFMKKKIWDAGRIIQMFMTKEMYSGFPHWRFLNLELWGRAYGINNL